MGKDTTLVNSRGLEPCGLNKRLEMCVLSCGALGGSSDYALQLFELVSAAPPKHILSALKYENIIVISSSIYTELTSFKNCPPSASQASVAPVAHRHTRSRNPHTQNNSRETPPATFSSYVTLVR